MNTTLLKSTRRNVKLNVFEPDLLSKHWFTSSVWNFCRWVADVPPRQTSPAAKSEEKRMFSQATSSSSSLFYLFTGKYFYIEATYHNVGDNAKLTFAVPRNKSSCCLKFFYHMNGPTMGTLNVFSGNKKIFTKSGNQGNYWKRVTRTVYFSDMVN